MERYSSIPADKIGLHHSQLSKKKWNITDKEGQQHDVTILYEAEPYHPAKLTADPDDSYPEYGGELTITSIIDDDTKEDLSKSMTDEEISKLEHDLDEELSSEVPESPFDEEDR